MRGKTWERKRRKSGLQASEGKSSKRICPTRGVEKFRGKTKRHEGVKESDLRSEKQGGRL